MRLLALVPDPQNRFPEPGTANSGSTRDGRSPPTCGTQSPPIVPAKRPILAIVDVQSQAYGRLEALLGIHLSLAAAADAYATARMAGHPVVALIVGTALSGGLLGHGAQAHRLLALDDPRVVIQAMRKQSAARHAADGRGTRRTRQDRHPHVVRIRQFAKLGLLHELITGIERTPLRRADRAGQGRVAAAIADIRQHPGDLTAG